MTPISSADKVWFLLGLVFLVWVLAASAHHFAQ